MKLTQLSTLRNIILIGVFLIQLAVPQMQVQADAVLTLEPLTWNVIGLDSNNVNVGPNNFPVGARICNTGDAVTGGLIATLVWDSVNDFVDIRPESLNPINLSTLDAGTNANPSCYDFYFEVSVDRDSDAYDTTRQYHIEVSSAAGLPEFDTISTVTPREIYIEHLISQNRNSTDNVSYAPGADVDPASLVSVAPGGTLSLMVGNIYTIRLDASTATQGYNQLEDFINFPNTVFQILSVKSTYTANSSGYVANSSDMLYADACLWDMDPASETYLSCIGSDGKVGGTISTTYNVKIIGGAGTSASLNTLIYDFSGSSFHYNSDFSSSSRIVTISSGITLAKSFSPSSITPGSTSTLTLELTNTSATDLTGISLSDNLPGSPAQMVVATPTGVYDTDTDCLSPVFTPDSGNTSLIFTGGVKANSTCTISVNVTAGVTGTYVNTTEELLLNGIGSGITASANLMVEDTPSASCTQVTIAQWTNFATSIGVVPIATVNNTGGNAVALYNGTQQSTDGTWWLMKDASTLDTDSIANGKAYFGFQITTTGLSNVKMSFNYTKGSTQAAEFLDIYYNNSNVVNPEPPKFDGVTLPLNLTGTNDPAFLSATDLDFSGKTNPSGDTYFYIFPYGAQNSGGVWTGINSITFSACLPLYSIQKSFAPDPIPTGDTSVLTFELHNADSNPASSTAFSDTLPAGMTITSTAATSDCGGSLTATEGTSEIVLTGGTIPAKPVGQEYGVCTITVNVTTADAGVYPNTSSYLSVGGTTLNSKANDTLTVLDPPVLSKSFSPNPIYSGNISTLTFKIQNPNPDQALTGVSFSDTFPANLTLAAAPASPQCGGTVTSTSGSITLSDGTLAAGETCTLTASVTSTLVGEYLNTSSAVTATETGDGNTASDILVVQAVHPAISILKEVATSSNGPWANKVSVEPGGDVYYRVTVENIGDVPLTTINVSDVSSPVNTSVDNAIVACSWPAVLPVGSSTTDPSAICIIGPFTAVTETNVNTATAHGTYNGTVYNSDPDTATYATTSLSLAKNVESPGYFTSAGDSLTFTYTITNLSDAELPGIFSLYDTNLSSFTCLLDGNPVSTGNIVTLAANNAGNDDTIVCTGVYSVTAFDVSVGSVTNTAYATIGSTRSNSDRVTVFVNEADLIVSKTNDTNNNASTGTVFAWDIRVSNQGPADAIFSSGDTMLSDALPAGASYSVSQPVEIANILCAVDGGNVLTCTANGTSVTIPGTSGYFTVGVDVTPSVTGSLSNSQAIVDPVDVISESNEGNNIAGNSVNVTSTLDLGITKDDGVGNVAASDPVSYSIVVTNNGPAAADGAFFSDPAVSNLTVLGVSCGSVLNGAACPAAGDTTVTLMQGVGIVIPTLPATGSVTFTVSGTAGSSGNIVNTAYINPPSGTADSIISNNAATDTDIIGDLSADLSISKDDSVTEVTAGAAVSYTVIVTNSGPSAANGAVLTDPSVSNLTVSGVTCDSTTGLAACPDSGDTTVTLLQGTGIVIPTLPSGGTVTFTVSGTAAASGSIVNTASVAAPSGTTDSDTGNNSDTDTDTINPSADLSISKDDSVSNIAPGAAVSYTVIVTNSGPSAANGAVLTDPSVSNLTVSGITCDSTTGLAACPDSGDTTVTLLQGTGIVIPTLPSGGTVTFTVSGTAGASGSIVNTASIAAPSGTSDSDTGNNSDTDTDNINVSPELTMTKTSSTVSITAAGQVVPYTYVVTNSGSISLTNVTLVDDNTDSTPVCTPVQPATLAPGAHLDCTAQYTVTQADLNAGGNVSNTATADSDESDPDTNSLDIPVSQNPSLTVTKSSATSEVTTTGAVPYTYVVTNSGNVTLTNVTLADNHTDAVPVCSPAQPATLAPGAHLDCTAQYSVTQADLNSGGDVSNTATADSDESGSAQDSLELPITQGPELTVMKTSSTVAITEVNQVVPYTYVVTNSGNITLNNVTLVDDNTDATPVCSPVQPAVLAPGDHLDCTAQHTVTQTEMNNGGNVSNTATADSDESDPAEDSLELPIHQISIGTAKRAVSVTEVSAGTYAVTYDILVRNYSNVVLSNIQVTDDLDSTFPSPVTYTIHSLSSSDFTVNYPGYDGGTDTDLLDGSDILAAGTSGTLRLVVHVVPTTVGPFENSAFASGDSPTAVHVSDESSDGTDPDNTADCSTCVNNNGDPTDNTKPTEISFGPNLFDPPSGIKTYDDSGLPILRWTMVWINDSNILTIDAQVNDPIPSGTVFVASGVSSGYPVPGGAPADSTNLGVSCTPDPTSTLTTTTLCYYEGPTPTHERGRIIWQGSIGPDLGATNAANASNEISISFNVDVEAGVTSVSNTATVDADLNGDGLINSSDGETSVGVASAVRGLPETEELPKTGFTPDVVTELPVQPEEMSYSTYGDVWLEIPSLGVQTAVVGVPYQLGEWNVNWLGEQTGWLQGTAFPSFAGNSVLTAHVYLPNGEPGPFIHLRDLQPNAEILVHAFGLVYVYQVQSNLISLPSDLSALQHDDEPWLTLLTCMGYDEDADLYRYRIKVRAVLMDVRTEPLKRTDR